MIVDFHNHYTPPELMEVGGGIGTLRLDERGNPNYRFNPLLADLAANVGMMDRAGIDMAVLSCGSGFDQPKIAICRLINDRLRQAERDYPGRVVGLAHVPALNPHEAVAELKRCAVELGFPGVAIASEIQEQALDTDSLRPFWKTAADLGLYVFIHPLPRVIGWAQMDADDLGRMLGWEFSLMVATVRLINCGGPDHAAVRGAEWVRSGLTELPSPQVVFGTDYPQAVHDQDQVAAYVTAVRDLRIEARAIFDDANAKKLIPSLQERLKTRAV